VKLIELSGYSLTPFGKGKGIYDFDFVLSGGDVCCINAGFPEDAKLFLRAVATLERPERGAYRYKGETLDFSDYRLLLPFKRKIAYMSPDVALISNRTLLDNLLLMKVYFDNTPSQELPDDMAELCRYFQLEEKLHLRPAQVSQDDIRLAIIIRELGKKPELLLLERPREFMGYRIFNLFTTVLNGIILSGIPVVFLSEDEAFAREIANREVRIADGKLKTFPLMPGNSGETTPGTEH
jgi:ABC-type polar amino acid transport system ATPase subunit